jgi:plastocyanin
MTMRRETLEWTGRRSRLAIAAAVASMAVPACDGSDEPPTCLQPVQERTVTMDDFLYLPNCVEAAGGTELEIVNDGQAPHTFTIESDEAPAEVDVPAGERAPLTVPELPAGTYLVTCTYHPQMEGALRVPPPA